MNELPMIVLLFDFIAAMGLNVFILQNGLNKDNPYLVAKSCAISSFVIFLIFSLLQAPKNIAFIAMLPQILSPWFLMAYGIYKIYSGFRKHNYHNTVKTSSTKLIWLSVLFSFFALGNYFNHVNNIALTESSGNAELFYADYKLWLDAFAALAMALIWLLWFLLVAWIGSALGKIVKSKLTHRLTTVILGATTIAWAINIPFEGQRLVTLNVFKVLSYVYVTLLTARF